MKWEKRGLIYCPQGDVQDWINNTALTPTPYLLTDEIIRVYCSFRDINGIGRIGYLDLDARNPNTILNISDKPVLDIGRDGCFDDNGVILGDIIKVDNMLYMYYVGFQLVKKVKFYAFSGLAKGEPSGEHFTRVKEAPVMDRTAEGLYGRCIHSVMHSGGKFRVWYSVIYDWTYINGIPYPTYDIKYIESNDGVHFPEEGVQCIKCNETEYRIGRPRVRLIDHNKFEMRYTSDTLAKEYKAGYAESADGIFWIRKDHESKIARGEAGWDSEMACYPAVITTKYGTYMFYDGNGMGKAGFGYAQLT